MTDPLRCVGIDLFSALTAVLLIVLAAYPSASQSVNRLGDGCCSGAFSGHVVGAGSVGGAANVGGAGAGGRAIGTGGPPSRRVVGSAVAGGADATPPDSTAPATGSSAATPATPVATLAASVFRIEVVAAGDGLSADTLGVRRRGSAVLIGPQLLVTIGYLLLDAQSVDVVGLDGRRVPGSVAGFDHATGFGLVRAALPVQGRVLELGDSDQLTTSQKVLTLGEGERDATELVVVSRKPFTGAWEYGLDKPIFTFPPVNNWSGSALVDQQGRLVGIGSLVVRDAAAARPGVPGNLFVPVNLLKPILPAMAARGRRDPPVQPWLGMTTERVRGNLVVARVVPDGPADRAGVHSGDIVVAVGDDRISDQADFYRRVWAQGSAGVEVKLTVQTAGALRLISVLSADRADFIRKAPGI